MIPTNTKMPKGYNPDDPDDRYLAFAITVFVIIVFFLISAFLFGCRTTKTPEQKQYETTQKELIALQTLRAKYPCDTSTKVITVRDTAVIFTTDTSYIPRSPILPGSTDTILITNYKTITKNVDHYISVIDNAALASARDSAAQSMYLFAQCTKEVAPVVKENTDLKAQVTSLKKWKTGVLIGLGMLVIMGLIAILIKVKKVI